MHKGCKEHVPVLLEMIKILHDEGQIRGKVEMGEIIYSIILLIH